jgi:DNA polymerase III alpha subunit (gram-positive type)
LCWAEITETTTKYNLAACCERAGIEMIDGHRAMNDVMPTTDLLRYFITRLRSNSEVTVNDGVAIAHRQTFEW